MNANAAPPGAWTQRILPSTQRLPWATGRIAYLLVALVALLTFVGSLGNYFLMDDFWHLRKISTFRWANWLEPWSYSAHDNDSYWMAMHRIRGLTHSTFFFRPAVTVTYALSDALGHGQAWGFHFMNITLHVASTLVFLLLARRLLGPGVPAFLAGIFFAVHPAHCESVQWIAANGDLLLGLFFLLAFYGHVRAREEHPGALGWAVLAVGAFGLALCSKEVAVMFPAAALLYDLFFYRPVGTSWRDSLRSKRFYALLGAYAAVAGIYLGAHFKIISGVADLNQGGNYLASWRDSGFFSSITTNLLTYLWHFWTLFPIMPLDTREAWKDVGWLLLPAWIGLGALYWGLRRLAPKSEAARRKYNYFWLWQVVTVAPTLPVLMSQRFLYLPSAGFCLLLGLLLGPRFQRPRVALVAGALAAACLLVSVAMNAMWRRPSLMIREQIEQIAQAVPKPEPGSRFYLIDIWPPSYGLEEGIVRRYRDRSLDVQVLTFSPKILPLTDPPWTRPLEK
ncbi:MAG: glycosyltransferase family 39 protein, partial [Verrucomicrobiae bacterium]|nr:glycosyltransferase family 39 protein [Verrucomicrobiae bacterium]